jgi:hypothetical protein
MLEVPESIRAPASVPVSSAHGTPRIDKVKEDRLVRKVDMSIIPMIMVVYLFSFLDRGESPFWPVDQYALLNIHLRIGQSISETHVFMDWRQI